MTNMRTRSLRAAVTAMLVISGLAAISVGGLVAASRTAHAATEYAPRTVDNADPTPVLGWSSWSFTRFHPNTALIEAEANALASDGLTTIGYRYVNIDDG